MSDTDLYKTLANKETWSIEEVLALLCGPSNLSAIIRGETHEPMGELLETAANQGRFGMLATGIDKFYWEMMEPPPDHPYPDQHLGEITDFAAHYLRFIDWIEDEEVLDKIQLDDEQREEILDLIEALNKKRAEVKPFAHDIDFQKLVQDDLWSLTDLRIVLFGETYSSRYWPSSYHKYNFRLEVLMQKIDKVIQDAALVGRLEVHKIQNRPPLIDSNREDEIEQDMWEFGYFGIFDTDESSYRNQRYYHTPDLFSVLALKGFPIPKGVAASLDQNQIEPALELLRQLKDNMLYRAVNDKNPPNVQFDQVVHKPKIGLKDETEQDFFEKESDFWIVSIGGEKASGLRHFKGMYYISYLFKYKGKKVHVVDLDQAIYGTPNPMQTSNNFMEIQKKNKKHGKHESTNVYAEGMKGDGFQSIYDISKINTPVDKRTIKILIQNKEDLDIELDSAIHSGDTEDVERVQGKLEKLKKVLNIISFRGKGKTDKPERERARQRIQRAIKDAIGNIKDKNPALGKYLSEHVKTGEYCSYIG